MAAPHYHSANRVLKELLLLQQAAERLIDDSTIQEHYSEIIPEMQDVVSLIRQRRQFVRELGYVS